MGWLIMAGILLLLAVLPLGISVKYDEDGPLVKVIAGPIRMTVFPLPKKEKKTKQKNVNKKTAEVSAQQEKPLPQPPQPQHHDKPKEAPPKGGSVWDFLPLVELAFDFLGDFRRKLRLKHLDLKLVLGGGDPCDLAVSYGRAWAAVGNLMPRLERLFVIKKRDVEVECDFTASQTLVIARLDLTMTLGRLLSLITCYGVRALRELLKIKKKRKGGAAL